VTAIGEKQLERMFAWQKVERRISLPFAKVTVSVVGWDRLTGGWKVGIYDDVVVTVAIVDPLGCRLDDYPVSTHFDNEGARHLDPILGLCERDSAPFRHHDLDSVRHRRVVGFVAAVGEQEAKRMLTWRQIERRLRLPFTKVPVLLIGRDGLASRRQGCIYDNVMVPVAVTHAFRGRLYGDIFGAHMNVERTDYLGAVSGLEEAYISGRIVAAGCNQAYGYKRDCR
jgi:hypothetical protein